jgi:hypothetical protein
MEKIRRIIDKRVKEKFMMDDAYLNGYARFCGWKATLVYLSLCRHVDKNQYCFPSISLMAKEHKVCREVIMDGIKTLVGRKIIVVEKVRRKQGKWKNNAYILLDKSGWISGKNRVVDNDLADQVDDSDKPSRSQRLDRMAVSDLKETHKEGNIYKETHLATQSVAGDGINSVMKIFNKINPTLNWGNKTIRKAAAEMIARFGFDETKKMAEAVVSIQGESYAPVATNPYQMKEKLAQFKIYFDRQKNNKSQIIFIS